jgi:hypothetical protein
MGEKSVDVRRSCKALTDIYISTNLVSACEQGREISETVDFRSGMF